jgi:putative DNA primase/helicase
MSDERPSVVLDMLRKQSAAEPVPNVSDGPSTAAPTVTELTPSRFFDDRGLVVERLGRVIQSEGHLLLGMDGWLYRYASGVYRSDGDDFARVRVRELLGERFKRRHMDEVVAWLHAHHPGMIDAEPTRYLNLINGVLDWKTGKLHAHNPRHVSKIQLGVAWNEHARCPLVDAFLRDVLPEDAVPFAFELIGYTLYAGNPLRVAILLLGPGGNGKTVLLTMIRSLLGEHNVSAVSLQALAENRFAPAELFGKLANICGDLDARAVRQTDMFKAWTGGDPIMAERKHGQPFTFRPIALPIFSANEAPLSSDQTEAWFDRWVIVPMERRIPAEKMDPHLAARLSARGELEGLLVRAVEGLRRLMTRGRFELPGSVNAARGNYRERLDSVQGFAAEACVFDATTFTSRKDLYAAYRTWAQGSGRFPVSAATFYDRLRRDYKDQLRSSAHVGTRGFLGIRLAQPSR